jgi:GNAT superfamily N-acetyltransferase
MATPTLLLTCSEMTDALIQQCARLSWIAWPKGEALTDRVARWAQLVREPDSEQRSDARFHLVLEGEQLVAMALSFRRVIACEGKRFPVLALASVVSDPERRGFGHGRAVVESAFARHLEMKLPFLFQTGVPAFYERLGACCIVNPITTSIGERAFWQPHALRYPANLDWPTGIIDLCGPGW